MKLLFLASHAWSEQVDQDDLGNVVDHLMATLAKAGPIVVHAPANRPSLVRILEEKGFFPVCFSAEEGPPLRHYDRGFFLSPSPTSDEAQAWLDELFATLASVWLVVHVPPGSTTALVQRRGLSPEDTWVRPPEWDLEPTPVMDAPTLAEAYQDSEGTPGEGWDGASSTDDLTSEDGEDHPC